MWDLAEDFTISVCTFHNLRQEISNGISIYSKEEIVEAKEIVENKVGPGVIEEKDAEFFLLELDPPNNSNLITIYVMFEENKKSMMSAIEAGYFMFWMARYFGWNLHISDYV